MQNGFSRVDHVQLSPATAQAPDNRNVFIVQGDDEDPAMKRVGMNIHEAANVAVEESFEMVVQLDRQRAIGGQSLDNPERDQQKKAPHSFIRWPDLDGDNVGGNPGDPFPSLRPWPAR